MSESSFTDQELLAYLDERLSVEQMASVEKQLRRTESLRRRASAALRRRESGAHTIGEIWREARLSCPSRGRLGSYLLGTLAPELSQYLDFHVRTIACRYCTANLRDLETQMDQAPETQQRRRRFFQSSAGYLHRSGDE